ncbi:MAG TPA: hypothetical protein VGU71_13860 [Candidatus Dormibacteraeota bacterium]|nr:hypothetical protein [Candidatus Dormibacteraeota bacterium]
MCRRHVEAELLHQPGQPGRLAFGQLEHKPRQRRSVDDRMLEWTLEPTTDQPGIERVVAVLNEHRPLSEPQECPARIPELRRADEHGAVDVMTLARIGVDRRAAVDQRVEERKRSIKKESFGAELEDQEWRVARRLDVDGDELGGLQLGLGTKLGCIDGDLVPRHGLRRTARLEEDRPRDHRASARARRAKRISSAVTALSIRAAAA